MAVYAFDAKHFLLEFSFSIINELCLFGALV